MLFFCNYRTFMDQRYSNQERVCTGFAFLNQVYLLPGLGALDSVSSRVVFNEVVAENLNTGKVIIDGSGIQCYINSEKMADNCTPDGNP